MKGILIRLIIFVIFILIVKIPISLSEKKKQEKFESCSFYTVMEPRNMSSYNYMRYDFYYDYVRFSSSSTVSAWNLGFFYNPDIAINNKYWVQVHCHDMKLNQVLWKIPVPDTLKYIPPKGWNKIPYGLKEESVWFKRWEK